jgi:hypothetical protein
MTTPAPIRMPPRKLAVVNAPADNHIPEGDEPADTATEAAAPVPAKKQPKKAAKTAAEKPGKAPKAKAEKKAAVEKEEKPAKAEKKAATKSTRPATDNVAPKIKAITSRLYSQEQLEVAIICAELRSAYYAPIKGRSHSCEIRGISERLQVILNEKLGLPYHKVYTQAAETDLILKFLAKIPAEVLPSKWVRAIAAASAAA